MRVDGVVRVGRVWAEALARNGVSSSMLGRIVGWIVEEWGCSEILDAARLVAPDPADSGETGFDRRVEAVAAFLEEIRVKGVNPVRVAERARICTSLGYPVSPEDVLRAAVAAALGYVPLRFTMLQRHYGAFEAG